MSKTVTYAVSNMRPVVAIGKVAEKNPDRLLTIHGDFRAVDDKGKPTGDILTFHSKEITREVALNPLTVIDVEQGMLTLPAGDRGRKALAGIGQDAITALLASVRDAVEPEAETVETPEPEAE